MALYVEIGDYLVKESIRGNLDLARSFRPVKPEALGLLEKRAPEIDMSAAPLRVAVALSAQYRALPAAVRDRLTVRQHRALLPVKDDRQKSSASATRSVAFGGSGDRPQRKRPC